MNIIRFTQFFQLTKNSKNLTFFVSSECELKTLFPKVYCLWCIVHIHFHIKLCTAFKCTVLTLGEQVINFVNTLYVWKNSA